MNDSGDPTVPAQAIYDLAVQLFPLARSLTGNGVRRTLQEIKALLPELRVVEVPSGTKAFDWTVPDEWNIRDAYIMDEAGQKVVNFQENNLHVMGYSEPVDRVVTLAELNEHLYSLPNQPRALPYVTSYYHRRWGFSIAHQKRIALKEGRYRAVIDCSLETGFLTYGELVLPGRENTEVLLSTYLCHPSMANDNLSGVCVTSYLGQWLRSQPERRYTYRLLFIPETIGAIVYLSRNLEQMKSRTLAGFVVTCAGDERAYSFVPSRLGNTPADKAALHVLKHHAPGFIHYSFLDRGSDERQYCSPGIDLPIVSVMRSKYRNYPEYHTSLDDLSVITPKGLGESFELLRKCIRALERNHHYRTACVCEPQMGKRGLFPTTSIKDSTTQVMDTMNLLAYCDGQHDLIDVANRIGIPIESCCRIVDKLVLEGLLKRLPDPRDTNA